MQSKGGYEEVSEIPVGATPVGQYVVSNHNTVYKYHDSESSHLKVGIPLNTCY